MQQDENSKRVAVPDDPGEAVSRLMLALDLEPSLELVDATVAEMRSAFEGVVLSVQNDSLADTFAYLCDMQMAVLAMAYAAKLPLEKGFREYLKVKYALIDPATGSIPDEAAVFAGEVDIAALLLKLAKGEDTNA